MPVTNSPQAGCEGPETPYREGAENVRGTGAVGSQDSLNSMLLQHDSLGAFSPRGDLPSKVPQ